MTRTVPATEYRAYFHLPLAQCSPDLNHTHDKEPAGIPERGNLVDQARQKVESQSECVRSRRAGCRGVNRLERPLHFNVSMCEVTVAE